jgi:5-formyltetrahydrofolate cyclo-ligase
MQKAELRRSLLKTRQSMSVAEWKLYSDRICTYITTSPLFTQAKTILAYFSFRQEPDLSPLFADISFDGSQDTQMIKRWGFPRCVGDSLSWHLYIKDSLQKSAYGIIEPHAEAPTIKPTEVDLIIIPCVACDRLGYRLGYGGGYYDRLLSSPEWATKPTIGIVFDFAYLPQLPIEPWDQPLQNICTEMGLTKVRN